MGYRAILDSKQVRKLLWWLVAENWKRIEGMLSGVQSHKMKGRTGEEQLTQEQAWKIANEWVAAWNAHDLDLILDHYDDAVELTSPAAAQLLANPEGKVMGKENLRAYFRRGLEAYPELHFDLKDVLCGVNSLVLYYTNQRGTHTAELMELSPAGKVTRVVANYSA